LRIWIDILTPKQVLFFHALYGELVARGHEVLLTARSQREVEGLLRLLGLKAQVIGAYGGADLASKLLASLRRGLELVPVVREFGPDLAVSFSSPECARVAFGLGIPHYAINDSPHAEHVARLTLPLSKLLMSPWVIPYRAWSRYGLRSSSYRRYRALDPCAWLLRLKEYEALMPPPPIDKGGYILIRTPELSSSYLRGVMFDPVPLLEGLATRWRGETFVVLPRYEDEASRLRARLSSHANVRVLQDVVFAALLLRRAKAFIGMGGTMTAEAVLMGVPSISAYPGPSTLIERFLLEQGCLLRAKGERQVEGQLARVLGEERLRARLSAKGSALLRRMQDPAAAICSIIERSQTKA
jgi:predicted glycosyltransferase